MPSPKVWPKSPDTPEAKERYLEDAEFGARIESARKGDDSSRTEERVARALKYAEWRWEGFMADKIASL